MKNFTQTLTLSFFNFLQTLTIFSLFKRFLPHVSLTIAFHKIYDYVTIRQSGFMGQKVQVFALTQLLLIIANFSVNGQGVLRPPSTSANWQAGIGYSFGSAVTPAGDVNGDGFDDLIVGAKETTTNFTNDGKVYVFLGSASGLSLTPSWSAIGANQNSAFGHSLAPAGDVNNDGYDDIIIGEPGYKVSDTSRGRVVVYYGSASGLSPTPSWTIIGTTSDLGRSVYTAGDVNNDGYDDVLVGSAYGSITGGSNLGYAQLYLGSASGLSSTPAWQVNQATYFENFANGLCTAGDINNDNYDDVIIGAPAYSIGSNTDEGRAYVYYGNATGLSAEPNWTYTGWSSGSRFGSSVNTAGDVNNDNYSDIIVGAPGSVQAFVFHGSASGFASYPSWLRSGNPGSQFGFTVSTSGDFDNDGFDDVVVGSPGSEQVNAYRGSVLGLGNSMWMVGDVYFSNSFGFTAGSAGDVNNDGFSDIFASAYSSKAVVFHGMMDQNKITVSGAIAGNGSYPTLTDAFIALNNSSQTGATIEIRIDSNLTYHPSMASLKSNSWNSVRIFPNGNITISDSVQNYSSLLDLDGADNVTIDGLNTGGNSLTISNTGTAGLASTIRFRNDASNNRITNCTILGSSDMSIGGINTGTILFSTTDSSTGNDNNSISYCNIGPSSANLPVNAIYFQGTTTSSSLFNNNDSILNCNIYDHALIDTYANGTNGIAVLSGNTDIVISGNKFYQTTSPVPVGNIYHRAIYVNNTNGNNFKITDNVIGYSASNGTGSYSVSLTNSGNTVNMIEINAGTTTASNVQGNIIKAISLTGPFGNNNTFRGIHLAGGLVNVGNDVSNIIGDSVTSGSITVNISSSTGSVYGISSSASNSIINNNRIYGIKIQGSYYHFYGINVSAGTTECRGNIIGSTVDKSIENGGTNVNIMNRGIQHSGGNALITENIIRNMNATGGTIFGSNAAPFTGIYINATGNVTVSKNKIHTLNNTNPDTLSNGGACSATGIFLASSGTQNYVDKNIIHSLRVISAIGYVQGIQVATGITDFRNNMIRLGIDENGNGLNRANPIYGINETGGTTGKYYFNSIYIGGNPKPPSNNSSFCVYSFATGTRNYYNNILHNARSNNGSNGIHGCFRVNTLSGFTSNNNVLFANGTGGIVGYTLSQQGTIGQWRTATGQDILSRNANPQYINPNGNASNLDLHISSVQPSPAEGLGASFGTETEDIDGDLRASFTPIDIGADAGNFMQYDISPMSISYTAIPTSNTSIFVTFSNVTITDADGVNGTAGTRPRVYFKKRSDANVYNDNTNATAGWKYSEASNATSLFSFSIDLTKLSSPITAADSIQYFVVAQDLASTVHVTSNNAVFAIHPASVDLTAASFPVSGNLNSFTFNANISVLGAIYGNGVYGTLAEAFIAINTIDQTGANIDIKINKNTTETSSASLQFKNWNTLNITPSGPRTITGAIPAGSALINLNGADKVLIDGLNTDTNSLTLTNTTSSAASGTATITLTNDATFNVITRCRILGSSIVPISSLGGVVNFGNGSSSGNNNNVISYCNIGPAGANLPTKSVSLLSGGFTNSGDTIRNCNIYDYFSSADNSAGIYSGAATTGHSILNNRFYQTASRSTSGSQHSAIFILSPGNGFNVSGNVIGYSSAIDTGTYNLALATSSAKFRPISITTIPGTVSSIQGNKIAAINVTGSGNDLENNAPFIGIQCQTGSFEIGKINGNIIADTTSAGKISFSTNMNYSEVYGIRTVSNSATISNNLIGIINTTNTSTGGSTIYGIKETSGTLTCQNNIIGGTSSSFTQSTSSNNSTMLIGIQHAGAKATISGNIIRNMTINRAGIVSFPASVAGILLTSTAHSHTISGNTIYSLNSTSTVDGNVSGIVMSASGSSGNLVERNFIHSLSAGTPASIISGLCGANGSAVYQNNMIRLGVNAAGTGDNNARTFFGFLEINGTNFFYFNSVYIGGNPTTGTVNSIAMYSMNSANRDFKNNIFFNARSNNGATSKHYAIVLLGSTTPPSGVTSNNNILFVTGIGGHTGYYNSADRTTIAAWKSATGLDANSSSSNPNYKNPAGNSSTVDLHIGNVSPTFAEGNGISVPAPIITDFDGETRAGLTPIDIGADAGNFPSIDTKPMSFSFTPMPNDSNLSVNFNGVIITDSDGVQTSSGLQPRVYFKKKNDANSFTDNATSSAGWKYAEASNAASPFNFTLDLTKLNSTVLVNDTIQYFIVAQDMAGTVHVTSNSATFASYPASVELTSAAFPVTGSFNSYRVIRSPLSGDYTVGLSLFNRVAGTSISFEKSASGVKQQVLTDKKTGNENLLTEDEASEIFVPKQDGIVYEGPLGIKRVDDPSIDNSAMSGVYATLTAAVNDLKTWGSSGPVRFILLDTAYTSETLPIALNQWTGMSALNTLTIKPATGVTSTISGSHLNALIDFNGGDYITIDGSNTEGGTTKDLTLRNNAGTAIRFVNDARQNVLKNAVVRTGATGILFSTSTASGNDSNSVINNDITGTTGNISTGINNVGSGTTSAMKNSSLFVSGNRIYNFSSRAIQDNGNSVNTIYSSNEFYHTTNQGHVIVFEASSPSIEGFTFTKNNVHDLMTTGTNVIYVFFIVNVSASSQVNISNNFININSNTNGVVNAIYDGIATNMNVFFNTIVMNGTRSGNSESAIYNRFSASNVTLVDNILINNMSGGTASNFIIRNTTSLSNFQSNYNNFINSGVNSYFAYDGVGFRNDLSEWKAATSKDPNSISVNPAFVSNTDLHLQPSSAGINAGTMVAGITTDYDNQLRDGFPDIGADEYVDTTPQFITMNVKMFIEGFYNSATNLMVSDTVRFYLRSMNAPYAIVDSAKGKVSDSGNVSLTFSNAPTGYYYIQTKHRNSVETWSMNYENCTQGIPSSYDFTTATLKAYGNNLKLSDLSPLTYSVFSGDVNQSSSVDLSDIVAGYNASAGFATGYLATDVTGDDFVNLNDLTITYNNSVAFVSVKKP